MDIGAELIIGGVFGLFSFLVKFLWPKKSQSIKAGKNSTCVQIAGKDSTQLVIKNGSNSTFDFRGGKK
jgi:hypothetical protein